MGDIGLVLFKSGGVGSLVLSKSRGMQGVWCYLQMGGIGDPVLSRSGGYSDSGVI